jgi:predicted TPR repeat methyltransferase
MSDRIDAGTGKLAVPTDHARQAYETFAPFYDDFVAGHGYDQWTRMLLDAARGAGLHGHRLLDIACGTGESFIAMLDRGFEVTACDISRSMIAIARDKSRERATLLEHDMRELPRLGEFDLVWCLGDALNYLDGREELEATFAGMRANLAADGVVVFDVNTLATFRDVYSSLRVLPSEQQVIVLDGQGTSALAAGGVAEVWIDRLTPIDGERWARARSVHHHRHHAPAAIEAALSAAGLAVVDCYGSTIGRLERELDEMRHIKAVYVARHARA